MLDKHEDCKQEDLFYSELKSADESRRYEGAQGPLMITVPGSPSA